MELETKRLQLAEISIEDVNDIHLFYSDPEVDKYNTQCIPTDREETIERINQFILDQIAENRKSFIWKILKKDTNEFIGIAGINLSANRFKLGEIHYGLLPAYWGIGFATEVAQLLIKSGFELFNLHKVEAGVATENLRSIKILEKLGMTREGLRRKILPIRGVWKDNYHYAIVEDDPRDY